MTWWGRHRWLLEGFSRPQNIGLGYTALGRDTTRGVPLVDIFDLLSARLLGSPPFGRSFTNWGAASALELFLPLMALLPLLAQIQHNL